MLILLPPSEGKSDAPGTGAFSVLEAELAAGARDVLRHVESLRPAQRAAFYGVNDLAKAKPLHELNRAAVSAGCVKALERYTGVVYQNLGYATLKRKSDAERRAFVVSGFFGLVSGAAQLPYYKMPVNAWLAQHWRGTNTARLKNAADRKPVLSLLPQAYAKAIDCEGAVSVEFRIEGGRKAAGHAGKAIKGRFVRWLIENRVTRMADIGAFDEDGYRFDGANFIQR